MLGACEELNSCKQQIWLGDGLLLDECKDFVILGDLGGKLVVRC
jgi:hypothetical protein